jgi:RHS repeat-associated protein
MPNKVGLVRLSAVASALAALFVMTGVPAAPSSPAAAQAHGPAKSPEHLVTLAQRRAQVRAQTAPGTVASTARKMDFGRFSRPAKSATSKRKIPSAPRLPGERASNEILKRAAASSSPYYPWDADGWLTNPAGGVVSAQSDGASFDPVPGFFIGNVYPGEQLTVTDDIYLSCDLGCDVPPDPSLQVTVNWEVFCQGTDANGNPIDNVLVPTFGDVTVTTSIEPAPSAGIPYVPPGVAQASFTVPSTASASCPFSGPGFDTYVTVVPTMVVDSNGNTATGQESLSTEFGNGSPGVPAPQAYGAPCAPDSAYSGQATVYRGDPVNTADGECAEVATDALVNTPGYPLLIQRSYSSALTLAGSSGPLGPGWTMPWFASLSIDATTGNITFNAENGSQYVFIDDDGSYESPPGVESVLSPDGTGGYTLNTPQGDVLTFNSAGQLVSEDDAAGSGLSLTYTGSELTSVTDAAGQTVALSYTGGLLTAITLPDSQTIGYGYTGGLLTSATVPGGSSGETTTYGYTSSGLLSSITDPDGNVVLQNAYNAQGEITSQANGTGAVTGFSYTTTSSGLDETDTTEPDGGIWTDLYLDNVLLETIDPLGNKTYYSYNEYLEPVAVTDPGGGLTSMSYDESGNLLSETDPLGDTQEWAYDAFSSPTSYTDPDGVTTSYTFNDDNQLTGVTLPNGKDVTFGYTSGQMTSMTVPGGSSGEKTTYAYNAAGLLASVTAPGGGTTSYTYNAMGFPLTVTDPMSLVTTYGYSSGGLLTSVAAPGGGSTKYGYDAAGNVTSMTDPDGSTWTYGYTAASELDKVTDPLGNVATYGYDGDGSQTSYTDGLGQTTTTSYNADDWPLQITYSDGTPAVTYGYDANGDTTSITDGTGTRALSYDADGELTSESVPGSGSFSYAYDADGNITSRSYPDGTGLSYAYNSDDELTSMKVGSATTKYAYNSAGNLSSTTMPDGAKQTLGYNADGQVSSVSDAVGSTVLDAYGLTLNADGQPTQVAVTTDGAAAPTEYYGYDPAGRLASACASTTGSSACSASTTGEITYAYDQAGNLTSSETGGVTTANTYNADEELTQAVTGGAAVDYAYNADGELTSAGQQSYSYNAAGELSQTVTQSGSYSYGYDAGGDLTTTRLNGSLVQGTTWDPNNPLPLAVEDTSATGATTADYAWNPDGTLASMTTSAGSYQAVTDWLGSVTGLLNSAGSQVSETSYDPYGTPSTTSLASGAPVSSIGYAGSYALPGGTGLDDMRARDYSPATDGFTSVDPLEFLSAQPYAYAADDPVTYTDPAGLCSWYNLYCGLQEHWRGTLQVTLTVAGIAAAIVCTAATDGICGVALELVPGFEFPLGSLLGATAINEFEGALDYAISGGCHTWAGLAQEVQDRGREGLGEGALEEFVPLFSPSEGEHAVPTNWWETWSQFFPGE